MFIHALLITILAGSVILFISHYLFQCSYQEVEEDEEVEEEEILRLFEKPPSSPATDVYVSTRIFRIDSINDSENTFSASLLLFLVWQDDRTTKNISIGHRLSESEFENDNLAFNPNITIVNMKEGQEDFWNPNPRPKVVPASLFPQLFPGVEKLLLLVKPITGTFRQDYKLHKFPFDVQEYVIRRINHVALTHTHTLHLYSGTP